MKGGSEVYSKIPSAMGAKQSKQKPKDAKKGTAEPPKRRMAAYEEYQQRYAPNHVSPILLPYLESHCFNRAEVNSRRRCASSLKQEVSDAGARRSKA